MESKKDLWYRGVRKAQKDSGTRICDFCEAYDSATEEQRFWMVGFLAVGEAKDVRLWATVFLGAMVEARLALGFQKMKDKTATDQKVVERGVLAISFPAENPGDLPPSLPALAEILAPYVRDVWFEGRGEQPREGMWYLSPEPIEGADEGILISSDPPAPPGKGETVH